MSVVPKGLPRDDPRCQPDAYIRLGVQLYEVVEWTATTSGRGMLHVRNCMTGFLTRLHTDEVHKTVLVRAAPAPAERLESD